MAVTSAYQLSAFKWKLKRIFYKTTSMTSTTRIADAECTFFVILGRFQLNIQLRSWRKKCRIPVIRHIRPQAYQLTAAAPDSCKAIYFFLAMANFFLVATGSQK